MIKTNDFTDYYTKQHANMIKQFEQWFRCVRKSAAPYITPEQSERVHEIALKEYETLIPEIPYIGGKKVAGTRNLVGSVILLAYIRAFEKEGLSERVIGEIVYKSFDAFFARIPAVFGTLTGKLMFVPWYVKKRKKTMERVAALPYTEGFVSSFVPCVDGSFVFGQDVSECAIHKFYVKHYARKYVPYLCLGDYPMFRRLNIGFFRTKTIGHGDAVCDFRFKKGKTESGWPPENLAEWQGSREN